MRFSISILQSLSLGAALLLSGCGCRPGCQSGYFCNVYGQCVASSQPGHPGTGGHSYAMISAKVPTDNSCTCDNREFWLSVVGSGSVRATVQTIYRYRETHKTSTLYDAHTVSSDQPLYLGCDFSPQKRINNVEL